MSYLKNKITEEEEKLDISDRWELQYECSQQLKIHPTELGPLINAAKSSKSPSFSILINEINNKKK